MVNVHTRIVLPLIFSDIDTVSTKYPMYIMSKCELDEIFLWY